MERINPLIWLLFPSETKSITITNVVEKTESLKIDEGAKSKPVSDTGINGKASKRPQKEKTANTTTNNTSSSFADPEKLIEEILEKVSSSIVVSEMKEENIKQHDVVSSLLKKNLTLELKNLATMFKNTAYTEGFGAGIQCQPKRL